SPMVLSPLVYGSDMVLRVYRTAGKRVIRTQPDSHYYAKMRIPDEMPEAPDYIVNASEKNWSSSIEQLHKITGGFFKPLDSSGALCPILLYGASGVGKTRLAVEMLLSLGKQK
ncbi:MAG: hypothetical protein ACREQ5_14095, partial [Candidatus Dormibacteria bacterium]